MNEPRMGPQRYFGVAWRCKGDADWIPWRTDGHPCIPVLLQWDYEATKLVQEIEANGNAEAKVIEAVVTFGDLPWGKK